MLLHTEQPIPPVSDNIYLGKMAAIISDNIFLGKMAAIFSDNIYLGKMAARA